MVKKTTEHVSYHMENTDIELEVKIAMAQTMLALFDLGYTEIHLGGLIRIMGMSDTEAAKFDNSIVTLDSNFKKYVDDLSKQALVQLGIPDDATVH